MGYDDTKVVEARNFVRAISGEAAELATLDDAGRLGERPRRDGRITRLRRVGAAVTQPSKKGDAGFTVDAGPELPVRRIGVLGCGRIGRMHAGLLAREVPGYAVAARGGRRTGGGAGRLVRHRRAGAVDRGAAGRR
jgi:hypothetical protein